MIVYHGTTARRAQRICAAGFLPRKPSKRVWFAESRAYAEGRGRTQARRSRDRCVVLTCDLDLGRLRQALGRGRVMHRNRIVAIQGPVPVSVLRSWPFQTDVPGSPGDIAAWVNRILRLKPHRGVSPKHEGVVRLATWVVNRQRQRPEGNIGSGELLDLARRWLPEYFDGVEIDPQSLSARRRVTTIEVAAELSELKLDPRELEAEEALASDHERRRVWGIKRLAKSEHPDLFEWCALMLDDESIDVRAASLRAIACCETIDLDTVVPFADHDDQQLRAAALRALARHAGDGAATWIRRGLSDPAVHVRLEIVPMLALVDRVAHRELIEMALYDPHREVGQRASRFVKGGTKRLDW